LPILECGPHEQATNENGGQDDQEDENDLSPGAHRTALFPTKLDSTPPPVFGEANSSIERSGESRFTSALKSHKLDREAQRSSDGS